MMTNSDPSRAKIHPLLIVGGLGVGVLLMVRPWDRPGPGSLGTTVDQVVDSTPQADTGFLPSAYSAADRAVDSLRARMRSRPANASPAIGQFVYLIDVSASLRPAASANGVRQSAELLAPAIRALGDLQELQPERHRVSTIGSLSMQQEPLCEMWIEPTTVFTANDSVGLARALRACKQLLLTSPSENKTDIRGALANAAYMLQGTRKALRGIVMFSDLQEDLGPQQQPAVPNLSGMCVAVFAQITPMLAAKPALLTGQIAVWTSRLRGWGARNVTVKTTLGFDATELASFFRDCEES